MTTDPAIEDTALEVFDIEIAEAWGYYRMHLPTGLFVEGSSSYCLDRLHGLMRWDLMQSHPGRPLIHGATVRIGGKRFLIAAGKGTGKSTLALYLLSRGYDVESDEHLVIEDTHVIAQPRTLRIKPDSLAIVENLPPAIWQAPRYLSWSGSNLYAVSPALFGRPWHISRGRLDGMLFASPNHGGRSTVTPLSVDEGFRRLFQNAYFLGTGIGQMAARLRRLVTETPAYGMQLGSFKSAEWHLNRLAGT